MSHKKLAPPYEELHNLYVIENKTQNEIASIYGCSKPIVLKWFREYNIETNKTTFKKGQDAFNKKDIPELDSYEYLFELFINQNKPIEHIARIFNVSDMVIRARLNNFNLIKKKKEQKLNCIEEYVNNANTKMSNFDNISKATLSRWLSEEGQKAKPSNSYNRKFNKSSSKEKEITKFLDELNVDYETSNRSILNGKELDIVIGNLAIEYNGLFYHNEESGKNKTYHFDKTKKCEEKGIQLFHIYEDQWLFKSDIVKSMIKSKLGLINNKIFARKCEIRPVNKKQRMMFFEENHIQGKDNSSIAYGLYFENNLISCLSLKKPRYNKKYDLEIIRFATKLDMIVVGGFSKLLKHVISNHGDSIVTYSDNDYSTGKLYKDNGFILLNNNKPSYTYYNNKDIKRYHRSMFTKKVLLKLLKLEESDLTENDLAKLLKLKKIWNSGTKTWVYNKKPGEILPV